MSVTDIRTVTDLSAVAELKGTLSGRARFGSTERPTTDTQRLTVEFSFVWRTALPRRHAQTYARGYDSAPADCLDKEQL